jgi:hypothetical protein
MMSTIRIVAQPGWGTGSGTKVWPFNNIGTAPTQVVGPNAYRESITFSNPGTATVFVGPLTDANGKPFTPSMSALGGTFPVVGGAQLTIVGECQVGWQALALSGTTNPFTVYESNLS